MSPDTKDLHMSGYPSVIESHPPHAATLSIADYAAGVAETDIIDPADFGPIMQGLYGEVGGIMSTAKKHVRDGKAYPGFRCAAEEEFGDALWYFAALCRRLNISLNDLLLSVANGDGFKAVGAASDVGGGAFAQVWTPTSTAPLDATLFKLGRAAAALLDDEPPQRTDMEAFALLYLEALHASGLCFANVARSNLKKARGAFIAPKAHELIDFDAKFPSDEQLPRKFRIQVSQRQSGKSYLQWHGVFIGDPLTDNIADPDGYRFHDVFHFAYVAILHWSPVIRALIKHKRKSVKEYDEAQDSGRAIVVEEGLTAWIFARAKELNFFEGQDRVSLGILKTIGEFVDGYEVEACPPKLWERAILEGYAAFRQIRDANGGWIVGDRESRTIRYEALESME